MRVDGMLNRKERGGWRPRAAFVVALAGLLALLVATLPRFAPSVHADGPAYLYIQSACTPVYTFPSKQSALISLLLGGNEVTAIAEGTTASWAHVRIWSGVEGYVPAKNVAATQVKQRDGACAYPGLAIPDSVDLPRDAGPWALAAQGVAASPATLYSAPDDGSVPVAALPLGQPVSVTQWAPDSKGQPWYRVDVPAGGSWARATSIRLTTPDPAARQVGGGPIWAPVAGKGMWATNFVANRSDVNAMARAAKAAGITHIYTEVAITGSGFYGTTTLDRLIPAAHAAGVKVIAWVYADLTNVSDDIRLAALVANHKTPGGERPDGLAADIERLNGSVIVDSGAAYSYGQALRALLGPDALMVAAVPHPFQAPGFPYAAIAASFNVIAPMDYWHSRQSRSYTPDDVRRFVATSVTSLRAAMRVGGGVAQTPIEELGQMYDMFATSAPTGQSAPTGDEITADLEAARQAGCIGASYFDWRTATQAQWAALAAYAWA